METKKNAANYASAGVDLDEAQRVAESATARIKNTFRPSVLPWPGGFAAVIDPKKENYKDPLIVFGTDGVGTKLELATELGWLDGIGIDLVAMSVNDVLTSGAAPIAFVDYVAYSNLEPAVVDQIIASVAAGCEASGCSLVGGETAQMPGLYQPGQFDLAGACIGFVERDHLMPKTEQFAAGDVIIGLPSSGPHSNGYSLIRKLVASVSAAEKQERRDALLAPTRLYHKEMEQALALPGLRAAAHITGGGLDENLGRLLVDGQYGFSIDTSAWQLPELFQWLQQLGELSDAEVRNVFNAGIGFCFVVDANSRAQFLSQFADAVVIGEVVERGANGGKVLFR